MNLGIFLSIGDGLKDMKKSGQDERFINLYLKRYLKAFDKVYLFSYDAKKSNLPKNVVLICKNNNLHRYLYALLLPIIHRKVVENCDVIRGFGLSSSLPSFLIAKPLFKKNIPFVFNWPYDYWQFLVLERKKLLALVFKILEITAFSKAKFVLIATKEKLNKVKGQKYIYIPNGVNTLLFKPIARQKNGMVFVGRLEKQKNLTLLINAISKMPKKLRNITLIGNGSQEQQLKKFALVKNVNLKIISKINNSDLPKELSKYKLFVSTSLAEGSPKALLEAMAVGLVPVVTNFNTAKEVIDNNINGFITNYDINEFSVKCEKLLTNRNLLSKMSKETRNKIKKEYKLENLLTKEINILKKSVS